jgi:hypothetical protein
MVVSVHKQLTVSLDFLVESLLALRISKKEFGLVLSAVTGATLAMQTL